MTRLRCGIVGLIGLLLLEIAPPPATAWSNGQSGPNYFGTHDWVLKKAIKAAGNDANWVRVRVALRATDDPDTKNGINQAR